MRKKTKQKILLVLLSIVIFFGSVGAVYLFQDFKIEKVKNDYDLYIQQTKDTKTKGYMLTNDMPMGKIITKNDIKPALLDPSYAADDTLLSSEEIIGKALKVAVKAKQPITASILYDTSTLSDDLRAFELSSAVTPSFLEANDYVDIRISFPTGLDYVVLSKKRVDSMMVTDDEQAPIQYLRFLIDADEILRLSSAIVDAFYKKGTYLYVIKYVEPDAQKPAIVNYPVNDNVRQLILTDPNIVSRAQLALEKASRDALMASFSGLDMMEVREKPQTVMVKEVMSQEGQNPAEPPSSTGETGIILE